MPGKSPSSRRAWIEITMVANTLRGSRAVALLAEGVDRNFQANREAMLEGSRPPRGGRG